MYIYSIRIGINNNLFFLFFSILKLWFNIYRINRLRYLILFIIIFKKNFFINLFSPDQAINRVDIIHRVAPTLSIFNTVSYNLGIRSCQPRCAIHYAIHLPLLLFLFCFIKTLCFVSFLLIRRTATDHRHNTNHILSLTCI